MRARRGKRPRLRFVAATIHATQQPAQKESSEGSHHPSLDFSSRLTSAVTSFWRSFWRPSSPPSSPPSSLLATVLPPFLRAAFLPRTASLVPGLRPNRRGTLVDGLPPLWPGRARPRDASVALCHSLQFFSHSSAKKFPYRAFIARATLTIFLARHRLSRNSSRAINTDGWHSRAQQRERETTAMLPSTPRVTLVLREPNPLPPVSDHHRRPSLRCPTTSNRSLCRRPSRRWERGSPSS